MDEKILLELNELQWGIESLSELTHYIRMSGAEEACLSYDHLMLVFEHSLNDISQKLKGVTDYFDQKILTTGFNTSE